MTCGNDSLETDFEGVVPLLIVVNPGEVAAGGRWFPAGFFVR
jgi:hypothetical protein